jgi:hypothetical protein
MNLLGAENYDIAKQPTYDCAENLLIYRGRHIHTDADVYITVARETGRILLISSAGGRPWPGLLEGRKPLRIMRALGLDETVISYRCISCGRAHFVEARKMICVNCNKDVERRMWDGCLRMWLLGRVALEADVVRLIGAVLCELL